MTNTTGLLTAALGALPAILALIKDARAKQDPSAPPMTDAEAFAALAGAVAASVAIDETWKRLHPPGSA